ncbi:NifU family protein [Paraburkholderia sp. GAS334]|uniref:NifU family protein n=1 Tax=Paraburkholderia sp. GAS334 TaxID=3035131 RepID=UPI003D1C3A9B
MKGPTTYLQVREALDSDVRPNLKIHGGDVEVVQVTEDGCVQLEFEGACRGCALQSVTFAVGVRQRLLEVPGVSEVTMKGVKVSSFALDRISQFYKGYSFQMNKPRGILVAQNPTAEVVADKG